MNRLDQLKSQHESINKIIADTKKLLSKLEEEKTQLSIAKNISQLAGILKIHLGNEDRFLYPEFMKSSDIKLRTKADNYISEMGDLNTVFTEFKNQYNTSYKIKKNLSVAKKDIETTFSAVEKRIHKEDHDLYVLAEKL